MTEKFLPYEIRRGEREKREKKAREKKRERERERGRVQDGSSERVGKKKVKEKRLEIYKKQIKEITGVARPSAFSLTYGGQGTDKTRNLVANTKYTI